MDFHAPVTTILTERLQLEESSLMVSLFTDSVIVLGALLAAGLIYLVCYRYLTRTITRWIERTENTWDDELIQTGILKRCARFAPVLFLWSWIPAAIRIDRLSYASQVALTIVLFWMGLSLIYAVVNTFLALYSRRAISKEVPLHGIAQTIKILLTVAALILTLSQLLGKSPTIIFSGLGALTAILMLVFKDAILGLAAGIQLTYNRMVAVGDWIEVPKYGANGAVLEVALTTVKVQNWDKTITTVPTYALISDSFKNWRGMSDSGLRRIKRSLNIHLDSVRFLTAEEIQQHQRSPFLQDYLTTRLAELHATEHTHFPPGERRLTNIGVFRAYVESYLQRHPLVSKDATTMVRQLQPTEHGIPIELYLFANDNRWVEYEGFQSDLFDHLIAILPQFALRLHQAPSASDLAPFAKSQA